MNSERRKFVGAAVAAGVVGTLGGSWTVTSAADQTEKSSAAKGKTAEEVSPGEDLMREHGLLKRIPPDLWRGRPLPERQTRHPAAGDRRRRGHHPRVCRGLPRKTRGGLPFPPLSQGEEAGRPRRRAPSAAQCGQKAYRHHASPRHAAGPEVGRRSPPAHREPLAVHPHVQSARGPRGYGALSGVSRNRDPERVRRAGRRFREEGKSTLRRRRI